MALHKQIQDPSNDAVVKYWRVELFAVSLRDGGARIVLAGYASHDSRLKKKAPLALREYNLTHGQAQLLLEQSHVSLTPEEFAQVLSCLDALPEELQNRVAVGLRGTVKDALLAKAYAWVRDSRRTADTYDSTTGGACVGGEKFQQYQVKVVGGKITVPSEFANAVET